MSRRQTGLTLAHDLGGPVADAVSALTLRADFQAKGGYEGGRGT